MKLIYTIWSGEYSDANIDYVTEDSKKAQAYVESWWSQNPFGGYNQPYIQEYLVDDWDIQTTEECGWLYVYKVKNKKFDLAHQNKAIKPNTTVGVKLLSGDARRPWNNEDQVFVWLAEKDNDKALKIAQDAYTEKKYEQEVSEWN